MPKNLKIVNQYKINHLQDLKSARDWIRTSTSLRMLRPEHSASTNFATRALDCKYNFKNLLN